MAKNILICADGTWNKDDNEQKFTNVAKLSRAAIEDSEKQKVLYIRGVGTSAWDHIRGGAFAFQLSENVIYAYKLLTMYYEPGDTVFLFGFSRGAFTVRSLSGLLLRCGLIRKDDYLKSRTQDPSTALSDVAGAAYKVYREKLDDGHVFKTYYPTYSEDEFHIHMIGVWDTVSSLGVPIRGVNKLLGKSYDFHNAALNKKVRHGYHALSIDENRKVFRPELWDEPEPSNEKEEKDSQTIEQVWFIGDHSNVGGGHKNNDQLSDIALKWMIDKAKQHGVLFNDDYEKMINDDHCGDIVGPFGDMKWFYVRREPRKIKHGAKLHESVERRIVDSCVKYCPKNLEFKLIKSGNSPYI